MQKDCQNCYRAFEGRSNRLYCSEGCRSKYRQAFYRFNHHEEPKERLPNGLRCRLCWEPLVGRQTSYCSVQCHSRTSARDARDKGRRSVRSVEEEPMKVLEGETIVMY